MWVVFDTDTGWSEEDWRFADRREAMDFAEMKNFDSITFDTRIGGMPWGRFELGQRVEVDLALAVLTPITYTP